MSAATAVNEAEISEAAPAPIDVVFDGGLPGFADARHFRRVPWGDAGGPFSILECADREGLAFVVVPPVIFFPDYAPTFDRPTLERLGPDLRSDDPQLEVLVILTLGERAADATANLLGPIVIHAATGHGVQAVLAGSTWSARAALVPHPG